MLERDERIELLRLNPAAPTKQDRSIIEHMHEGGLDRIEPCYR